MLRLLRRIFGTIALLWIGLWLIGLIVFAIAPKAENAGFPELMRFNYLGVPASLIWAVLKVVSALKASRAEPPISLAVADLPFNVPTGGFLSPVRVAPQPVAQPIYPSGLSAPSRADVYAYSAPGLAGGVLSPERIASLPVTQPAYPSSFDPASKPDVYTYSAPGLPMCPQCGERPAIFYCLTHRQAACLQCVAKHDQPAECFYVPAFRVPKPK